MKRFWILFYIYSTCLPASICSKLIGTWQGFWQDESFVVYSAQMTIEKTKKSHYEGIFYLSNGTSGKLNIKCEKIKADEAYLTLDKDAPFYNLCRGSIIEMKNKTVSHFFCYKPNQNGYFKRDSLAINS